MSLQTERKNSCQVIRLVTDMVAEPDVNAVRQVVEKALKDGLKKFVFSVSVGALSNRMLISRLLLWCNQTIKNGGGQMLFVEKNPDEVGVFRTLCESLHIPIVENQDTAVLTIKKE